MYAAVADVGVELVASYGLFVLLFVFILEGALVGKLIPTRTLFVATVLAVGSDAFGLLSVAAAAVVGATFGQFLLFVFVRRTELSVESLPGPAESMDSGRLTGWFDRWGIFAVAASNTLPLARGSLTVPVAMSDENALRFSASSLVGSSFYAAGLIGVAAGLDAAITLI